MFAERGILTAYQYSKIIGRQEAFDDAADVLRERVVGWKDLISIRFQEFCPSVLG